MPASLRNGVKPVLHILEAGDDAMPQRKGRADPSKVTLETDKPEPATLRAPKDADPGPHYLVSGSGLPANVTVIEDTPGQLDLSSITLSSDPSNPPDASITVVLTASAGTLAAASSGSVTVSGSGSGVLTLSGTVADVDAFLNAASSLTYTGAANAFGANAAAISVTADDGSGAAILGVVNVSITGVNDAPVQGANAGTSVNEGANVVITAAMLDFNDVEQLDANITFTLTSPATSGVLRVNGVAQGSFTQQDVANGLVSYTHDGGETTSDSFGFSVSDGQGGSAAGQTFSVTINPVNDGPSFDRVTHTLGQTFTGDSAVDRFGAQVANAGDVDGDGIDDLIIGAPYDDANGPQSGTAIVISGATGATLHTFVGATTEVYFGSSVDGAGDVDGDGHADLIVGSPHDDSFSFDSGRATVFSGATGEVLYDIFGTPARRMFGAAVSGVGDVNGDGRDDFAIGAPFDNTNGSRAGSVTVYSGATGASLYTYLGTSSSTLGAVSSAGDINGDGIGDLIVGAPGADDNGLNSGTVRVLSGADGTVIYTFTGAAESDLMGYVGGAGDVDGDGRDDLIVGFPSGGVSSSGPGGARVISGATGATLFTFTGDAAGDYFGYSVAGAGDVNGDGHADLLVGAPLSEGGGPNSGTVRVFSGATGEVLYSLHGLAGDWFGQSVAAADLNGDGLSDFIIGAPLAHNNGVNSGRVVAFLSSRVGSSLDATPTFTENGAAVVLDADADVSDAELDAANSYAGAVLTLARSGGPNAQDQFSGAGSLSLAGGNVVLGGVTVGTFTQDGGSLVITFNASATSARADQILRLLAYANTSDTPPASVQIAYSFNDGDASGARTVTGSVTVAIVGVNDAPSATGLPGDVTVDEAVASDLDLSSVTLTDPDTGDTLTVVLAANVGTLSATGAGGVAVANSGTGTVTLTGSAVNIDTFLNMTSNVRYTGPAGLSGDNAATVTVTADDGAGMVPLGTVNVDITPANRAPTLTGFGPSVTFLENTVNAAYSLIDTDVHFADEEGNFDGGSLTVSGLLAEDEVSFRNVGTGPGQIGLSGADITYGGVVIGTRAGGLGTTLTVTFNATATSAAIDTLIENLNYANHSNAPTATRDLIINVTDAAGAELRAGGRVLTVNVIDQGETYDGTAGADLLTAPGAGDTANGLAGDDILRGGTGTQTLNGGADNDTVDYGAAAGAVTASLTLGGASNDGGGAVDTYSSIENLWGSAFDDTLTGNGGANLLAGGAGADSLFGLNADDILRGGSGVDMLDGGGGLDTADYSQAGAGVTANLVTLAASNDGDGATDTFVSIENLTGSGFDDVLIGDSGTNVLVGGAGADSLTGGTGATNTLRGGLGDDTYVVSANDTIVELENEGLDTVRTDRAAFTLGAHLENLTYTGIAAFTGTGNAGDNVITGGAADDILVGVRGSDTLNGGGGADRLLLNTVMSTGLTTQSAYGGAGADYIEVSPNASNNQLTVTIDGGADNDTIQLGLFYGGGGINAGTFSVAGGDGNDVIRGNMRAGTFNLDGGAGDDTIDGFHAGTFTMTGGTGNDIISGSYHGFNTISGDEGNDVLRAMNGGLWGGFSTINGGSGDDIIHDVGIGHYATYTIDAGAGDDVVRIFNTGFHDYNNTNVTLGTGVDTVITASNQIGMRIVTITDFAVGAGGDKLDLTIWIDPSLLSNRAADSNPFATGHFRLVQNGADTLLTVDRDGSGAAHGQLTAFRFLNTDAQAFTAANFTTGHDPWPAGVGRTIIGTPNVDTLTGAEFDDVITGLAGGDTISGLGGADLLDGGSGADTLNGGDGADILRGGIGNDALNGGGGRDRADYSTMDGSVNARLDTGQVSADGSGGSDTLTGIEDLTGSGFDDVLVGDAGSNSLNGENGADVLTGRGGTDTLDGGGGLDTADYSQAGAGVTANLVTLAASNDGDGATDTFVSIENLTGSAFNDHLYGDGGNNVLRGNAGRDTLRGLGGNDTLIGGAGLPNTLQGGKGDDLYISSTQDTITELAGEGTDTLQTSLKSVGLGANMENLVYAGIANFNGRGNSLDNVITGGIGNDDLRGLSGNDTLNGGGGSDRMIVRGLRADYTVTNLGGGSFQIVDAVAGRDGTDVTTGVEIIVFRDSSFELSAIALTPAPLEAVDKTAGAPQTLPAVIDDGVLLSKDADVALVLPGLVDDGHLSLAKGGDLPLVLPGADGLDDLLSPATPIQPLRPKAMDPGPQVWGQETGTKDPIPEVLPGMDDDNRGGIGDARTYPGVFGGGADPWIPLTLDEAGDGFLTLTGGPNRDGGEPQVLPGEPMDDLVEASCRWTDSTEVTDPGPLTGRFTVPDDDRFLTIDQDGSLSFGSVNADDDLFVLSGDFVDQPLVLPGELDLGSFDFGFLSDLFTARHGEMQLTVTEDGQVLGGENWFDPTGLHNWV